MSLFVSSGVDTFETAKWTWDLLLGHLDPAVHHLWEPFRGTGRSTAYLRSCGFEVTNGDNMDFFEQTLPVASPGKQLVLTSNPPFSTKREVMKRIRELGVDRWALLFPINMMFRIYFAQEVDIARLAMIVHASRNATFIQVDGDATKPMRPAPFEVCWFCQGLLPAGMFALEPEPSTTRIMTPEERWLPLPDDTAPIN